MAFKITIFALAALVCQVYSQCGPVIRSPPIISPPCATGPVVTTTSPVVATTIVDNTVSNSLANAIQLLIVSKLIESTMTPNIVTPVVSSPVAYPLDVIPPIFNPVPEILPACGCSDVIDILPTYGIPEYIPYQNPCVTEIVTPSVLPIPYNDVCGCSSILPYPFEVNPYAQVLSGFDYPQSFGPYAADVLFPSSIPAQLRCNFGYSPANTPCVSYNVEPLAFLESYGLGNLIGNRFY